MGTDLPLLIVSFVVVLVPLIFVHELGHFLMAKLVGITVLEFGIGFPPRAAVLFKRGDTQYTLNWIPLGGFVRPLGEDMVGPVDKEKLEKQRREEVPARGVAVNDVSPLRRILFMAGGALFNLLLAVLLFTFALTAGSPVIDHSDITVVSLAWDSLALRAGVRPGDVIRAVDGQPLDFARELDEYLALHTGEPITLAVERDGQQLDFTFIAGDDLSAWVVDSGPVSINAVSAGSPAEAAGIEAGDIVLAAAPELPRPTSSLGVARVGNPNAPAVRDLDYTAVHTAGDLAAYVRSWAGVPVTFRVARGGTLRLLTSGTRDNPPPGEGATGTTIETIYPTAIEREAFGDALITSVGRTIGLIGTVIRAPVMLIRGEISTEEARPVSVVGISQLGGQFIQESVEVGTPTPFLQFAAAISVALGLTNLLPLPAFDGGRILFVLIEMIRGKPMDPAREGMIHLIGLMFLLGLMVVLIFVDIAYPVQLP